MRSFFILFFLVFVSCSDTNSNSNKISSTIVDSIKCDTISFSPEFYSADWVYFSEKSKLSRLSYLFTSPLANDLRMYDDSGKVHAMYLYEWVKDFEWTDQPISGIDIHQDQIFILDENKSMLYVFNHDGYIQNSIKLELPNRSGLTFDFHATLRVDQDRGLIFTSTVYRSTLKETMQKSKLISIFNMEGKFIRSFVSLPSYYTAGNLAYGKLVHWDYDGEYLYIAFPVGQNMIRKYSIEGEMIDEYLLDLQHHDQTLHFYKNDPTEFVQDQIKVITVDKVNQKLVLMYSAYTDNNGQEISLNNPYYMCFAELGLASGVLNTYCFDTPMTPRVQHVFAGYDLNQSRFRLIYRPEDTEREFLLSCRFCESME
ncbi:MAG: hypothetical protein LAT68_10700 [Cyclobacteriaceae bacterium]|nr:hypothetical protein [Cyclobacteriaceae bacterium]MCH8516785.1 hypothetical protein [Cyclobacteriaceae bacterium]